MARVTLTFEDKEDGESVTMTLESDPAFSNDEDDATPAQFEAVRCWAYASARATLSGGTEETE